ncbi:MAG: methyltransferase TrmH, group 1 [Acidobacteriales bacterium]|nr:methyltransferase TrmH, group 1 [Terriglobales bacterium]
MLTANELERLCVVLVSPRNPLNIGAAARAMSNFGFLRMRVVNPYEANFLEAKSAVGAASVLTTADVFENVADAVADCTLVVGTTAAVNRELEPSHNSLEDAAEPIRQHLQSGRVALLFGSEKTGLSNEALSHCHWSLSIPTRDEHSSMNLGQAVAVCLYELVRGSRPVPKEPDVMPAIAGDLERITQLLLETLESSGYMSGHSQEFVQEKMRREMLRLNLSKRDAELWQGVLRQILWKFQSRK